MKNFILLVTAAASINLTAQSSLQLSNRSNTANIVVLQPNTTIYSDTEPDDVVTITIDIKNTSATTKSYRAKRYDMLIHSTASGTASAYFCIAGTCYPAETYTSQSVLTLQPGESASTIDGDYQMLEADLFETTVKGLSIIKYTFFNDVDHSDSVQITIQYNGTVPTGLSQNKKSALSDLRIYPNPSSNGMITVESTGDNNNLEIINMLGSTVLHRENIAGGTYPVNAGTLPAGTYFVRVWSDKNTRTEKLIITK